MAGLTAAVLTGVASFLGSFLSLSDDAAWRRYALGPMRARYAGNGDTHDTTPGFVFLEIDGLAEPVLRRAIAAGYAPNLARWIDSGTHRLTPWECDISSQTSAMQAGILPALIAQPGIGFVVVETEDRGSLAIGRSGFHALRDDRVHGISPLEGYSPHVPALLRRASGFRNAPDILLMGAYWPETNEVAAFEELVSSHGGLGGDQSTPFVLSPVDLDLGTMPIVGASALHQVFKGWLTQSSGTQASEKP